MRKKLRLVQRAAGIEIKPRQQRIVVEHLLEMRHQPSIIDAVAMEPAADLIVNAALRHFGQRVAHHRRRSSESSSAS